MPRLTRVLPDYGALHITARGNNKRVVFRRRCDFKYCLGLFSGYAIRYACRIYHYVLMKTHLHLVVGVTPYSQLSKMMHGICLQYAMRYNKVYSRIGHFWQDRFKSFVIDDDDYLLRCGLYVERNPVRAGLVKAPEDYPWSSYNAYAFGQKDSIITLDPLYDSLGNTAEEKMAAYRRMMEVTMVNFK